MNQISSLLKNNLPAKILSVFAAVVLWFFVMNEQNPAVNNTMKVALAIQNESEDYRVIINDDDKWLKMKVRAPRSQMASYNPDDFYAYIDLSNAKEGMNTVKVQAHVPNGYEVVSLSSEYINVILEPIITRDVSIRITSTGNIADNMVLKNIRSEKTHMYIKGPSSILNNVDHLVGAVDVTGEKSDFRTTVSLHPVNSDGLAVEGVTLEDSSVGVTVDLEKMISKKTVTLHPVANGELPPDLKLDGIKIEPAKIEVSGEPTDLDKVTAINSMPIDLGTIKESCSLDVDLNLPAGIKAENGTVKININVSKK